MAALVHHEDVGSDADHATDVTLELPVGKSSGSGGHGVHVVHLPVGPSALPPVVRTPVLPRVLLTPPARLIVAVQLHLNGVSWRGGGGGGQRNPTVHFSNYVRDFFVNGPCGTKSLNRKGFLMIVI